MSRLGASKDETQGEHMVCVALPALAYLYMYNLSNASQHAADASRSGTIGGAASDPQWPLIGLQLWNPRQR